MKFVMIVVSVVLLFACGENGSPEQKTTDGVVPDYQMQALDKARGVEQSLRDSEQSRREESY